MNIVLVLHSTSIHFSLKYFRFVDPSPHQLFPGDQCGPRSPTCLPHPPPNGPSLRNNGDLKHPSHQPPDLADHNPGAHRFYHQRTSKFFCFGLVFFWKNAITVDGEVLLKKKKKKRFIAQVSHLRSLLAKRLGQFDNLLEQIFLTCTLIVRVYLYDV